MSDYNTARQFQNRLVRGTQSERMLSDVDNRLLSKQTPINDEFHTDRDHSNRGADQGAAQSADNSTDQRADQGSNRVNSGSTDRLSRILFDITSSAILILLLSPYLAFTAVLSRYRHGRVFDTYAKIGKSGEPFYLHRFSGDSPGRNLAVLYDVIGGKISWVGPPIRPFIPDRHFDQTEDPTDLPILRPGLISLYELRRELGTLYEQEPPASAYPNHSLRKAVGVIGRWLITSLLSSRVGGENCSQFNLLGIKIDNITIDQAIDTVISRASRQQRLSVAFVNPACANEAVSNRGYRNDLDGMDLVLPDGSGLSLACRMLGIQMKANINGTDLFPLICERAAEQGLSIFLLGAQPGVAQTMADKTAQRFPALKIAGHHHGYFHEDELDQVIDKINDSGADILLIAFGVPAQERWIMAHADRLEPSVRMGVGGLFDFYSERISRSPRWMQDIGMEWIWRFLQEPARMWRRYFIGNPLFVYRVWKQSRRSDKATVTNRFLKVHSTFPLSRFRFKVRHVTWKLVVAGTYGLKRSMDIMISATAILMMFVPLIFLAIILRSESPGPLFYGQTRVGRWGRLFKMYKFRSMYVDADQRREALMNTNEMEGGVIFKMKDDPRITRVGKFIRKYSIDELPQFWNVLMGDMSLVGPRPPIPSEVAQYSVSDRRRLEVKPGITCIWQVSGRSEIPFKEQVQLDVQYIESTSVWQDLKILFATIPAVLFGKGAY